MIENLRVRCGLIALACAVSISARAFADAPKPFEVGAGDLITALESVARHTEVELAFEPRQLAGLRTAGVSGVLTSHDAVEKLLQGTNLELRTDESTGAMMIAAPPSSAPRATGKESSKDTPQDSPAPASAPANKEPVEEKLPPATRGETAAATESVLNEVVVTAQKREQNLQDVGMSITALSGEAIRALGIGNATGISEQVPGLQLNAWSPKLTTFNLRGISQNNFDDHLEAPVAVYNDDVYIGSMNAVSAQLFDIQRVEVLRGPQGTLFGRNATGGLIHFVHEGATSERLNGYLDAGVAEYNKVAVEGAIGGAIAEGVRGRLAFKREKSDGYIKGTVPGVRAVGGTNAAAVRASLQADLSETLTADLLVSYADDSDVPTGGYVIYTFGKP
ncbi:MAG: TonB-dependent receptor plug domain-containing protein, partial [Gammaproteobacteria bacterium]